MKKEVLQKIQSDATNELRTIFESMDYKNFFNDSEKTLKRISEFLSKDFETLKKILKEGREFGVGTILSTQLLSHFSTVSSK